MASNKERAETSVLELSAMNDSLKKTHSDISKELEMKNEDTMKLSKKLECLQSKYMDIEKERDESTTAAVKLEADYEACQQLTKNLHKEICDLTALHETQRTDYSKEIDSLNERISQHKLCQSDLDRELKKIQIEIEKVSSEKKALADRVNELTKTNDDSIDQVASLSSQKKEVEFISKESPVPEEKVESENTSVEQHLLENHSEMKETSFHEPSSHNAEEQEEDDIEGMTCVQLRALCKKRGLKVGGNKRVLIKRLCD